MSFLVVGAIDYVIVGHAITSLNYDLNPGNFNRQAFVLYQLLLVCSAAIIVFFCLRGDIIDMLALPMWMMCEDLTYLGIERLIRPIEHSNWRQVVFGDLLGKLGESSLFGIQFGYWVSIVLFIIYLMVVFVTSSMK